MCGRMKWDRLLVEKRFHDPIKKDEEKNARNQDEEKNGRSQFEKDIDKITFSSAFRRLGRKTQVHLLSKNDHIHTRLSHSLEVASVGRSLGVLVGKWLQDNEDKKEIHELKKIDNFQPSMIGEIVEAACLAHDIGNPPFGHAAEEAIRKWFQENIKNIKLKDPEIDLSDIEKKDLEHFDGNAMAFRVVTYKEYYEKEGGMRLTYPTLGALLKYPWTSHSLNEEDNKFSCFKTEYGNICEIAKELDLIEESHNSSNSEVKYSRHPLAYLVEAADDICFHVLDIEDAIELNILPEKYFMEQKLDKFLIKKEALREEQQRLLESKISLRIKNGLLRGKIINQMIKEIVEAFENNYERIMKGSLDSSLMSRTGNDSLCQKIKALYKEDKLVKEIYQNQKNISLELGAYSVMGILLENSVEAACEIANGKKVSYKTEIIQNFIKQDSANIFEGKRLYEIIMLFLDYIVGMTDNYAIYINKQLLGLGN